MRDFDDPSSCHHPAQLSPSPATVTQDIQALHPQVTAALTSVGTSTLFYATNQPAHRARMHRLHCRHVRAYLAPKNLYFAPFSIVTAVLHPPGWKAAVPVTISCLVRFVEYCYTV